MQRVVSLLPSLTEVVCALGCGERLVGRSHECDHPADVARLPALTAPRLDPEAPSRAIDDRVRSLVRDGLSVYHVDAEALRALEPDLILTQDHCRACAASPADLEQALASWLGRRPTLLSLSPASLGEVWNDVSRVADALGVPEAGAALGARLASRISDVAERSQRIRPQPGVVCLEWLEPLMAAGNWVPELVALAGGRDLLGRTGEHSEWIEASRVADADPDAIVLMPCGFDLARTRRELPALTARPEWSRLRAVRERRVALVDGNQYFNRPGPRLVESLEVLAELLHPDHFAPRARGQGWEPL